MKRALIVDDKAENLYLLRMLLQGNGFEVDEARHGIEALKKARERPLDLIISDLLMPEMDGFALLQHWKEDPQLRVIPFIVYTATYTDSKDEKLALDMGADAFLIKPTEPEQFMQCVSEVLGRARLGGLSVRNPIVNEKVVLKTYSEVLVRKLERRTQQLEQIVADLKKAELEIRAGKDLSDSLISSLPGIFYHFDDTLRILRWNRNFESVTGYSAAEIATMNPLDLFVGEDRTLVERRIGEGFFQDAAAVEANIVTKDGRKIPHYFTGRRIVIGDRPCLVGMGIDITEQKKADSKIRRLTRMYAVLSGINNLIVRARDSEELFRETCRIAIEVGQFKMAWVGIVNRETARVVPTAWLGTDEGYIGAMPLGLGDTTGEGRGLAAMAITGRKVVVVDDMTLDTRITLRNEAQVRGFRTLAMLPLIVSEEVIGVLALYAAEVAFFDEEEMKLLAELAGDISFALDHIKKAARLDYLAYYDALTGLANRTLFHERVSQYVHAAQKLKGKLALILMNVERFKLINDSLGRQAGDDLLRQLADRLARAVNRPDIARIGGDHFAIVLPEIKGRSEIGRNVQQIWRECFAQPFRVNDTELRVSAKAGIALYPSDATEAETLFAGAEAALRKAQEIGERHQFHSRQMTEKVAEQLALENKLRQALEKSEFVLHYQPKVDLATQRIVGVEALIRWQSPELGLVPPMKFIPLMEETGLILDVGAWALSKAVEDHARWLGLGIEAPRVAVNVSAIQLRGREFVATVEECLKHGAAPTGIDLEITESLIMADIQGNIQKLMAVRDLGLSIAIDDFGTGYSSLGYLAKLPVQTLKIDRSFIIAMLKDSDAMTLVQTIISLAHSLRLKVVAEGVEEEGQARTLRLLQCDEMQGYLFSRPVPFDQMTALLRQKALGQ